MLSTKCIKCSRPAVVHLTEIGSTDLDNSAKHIMQVHLCIEHAIEAGLLNLSAGVELFKPGESGTEVEAETDPPASTGKKGNAIVPVGAHGAPSEGICPVCGMTWKIFEKRGLLNCPHDYAVFENQLLELSRKVHEGSTQHTGKLPAGSSEQTRLMRARRFALQQRLREAIQGEHYEEAAKLRDELKQLDPGTVSS